MQKTVFCRYQYPGVHCWPEAENYLKHPHRHMFHVEVEVEVTSTNREVEFIGLKEWLMPSLHEGYVDHDTQSCEDIAIEIMKMVNSYCDEHNTPAGRALLVEVSEDGENGARVYA